MKLNGEVISYIAAILLIILLGYTGIAKLVDFKGFRSAILNQPFPNEWGEIMAVAVPVLELAVVGLLLFNITKLGGFIGMLVVMTVYPL